MNCQGDEANCGDHFPLQLQLYRNRERLVLDVDSLLTSTQSSPSFDTLFADRFLRATTSYQYQAFLLRKLTDSTSSIIDSSDILTVTTEDTTGQSFQWSVMELGVIGVVDDVTIINDSLAFVVGEMHRLDSSGQVEDHAYGFGMWNGTKWTFRLDTAYGPSGGLSYLQPRGILAFSTTDVWMASGGVFHWDGDTLRSYWINSFPGNPSPILLRDQSADKIWGTSSRDLYAYGREGTLAHYDGQTWTRIETGTTLDITDMWGGRNRQTGESEVLAIASKSFVNNERKILKIDPSTSPASVSILSDSGVDRSLTGVWFFPGKDYYISGVGVYRKHHDLSAESWMPTGGIGASTYYKNHIRGQSEKDIAIACDGGDILHYNGERWTNFRWHTILDNGNYYRLDFKGNLLVAVGEVNNRPVVAIGRR